MLNISKKKQYQKTNEELSEMLVAKNAPIRNYSTCSATRNSRISYQSKKQQSQNLSEDKGITSRTYSVSEATELPKINNPTKVILKRPQMLPRPKQQLRKLIHVQTSPTNLDVERKQSNVDAIPYHQIEFQVEAEEVYILYKGFRNINSLNKICILSYNLIFGDNLNFSQNNTIKPLNYKQLIMKLKSESILVLQMNPNQKLNSIPSSQIDWFDCIYQNKTYHPKEMLSYELNRCNLWINIENLQKQFKTHQKINQYYFLDLIQQDSNLTIVEQDTLINKILLIDDETCKLFHLYVKQPINLQNLSQKMLEILKNNSIKELEKFSIEEQIKNTSYQLNQVQIKIKGMKYLEELKQKTKNHFKKINQLQNVISPEQRAERMRNQMVEYMKSNQKNKIEKLHFLVGDTIMRNIEMFRNHENDKFYRNSETVQLIEHLIKNNMPNFQINRSRANYAFYCL